MAKYQVNLGGQSPKPRKSPTKKMASKTGKVIVVRNNGGAGAVGDGAKINGKRV
jgi:hypothetical protein